MLPVLTASEFDSIRVECCEASKTYIKRVELTKNGRADPMVDELSSAPFDLWAREHDYTKLQKNQPQFRQRCGSTISASEAGRSRFSGGAKDLARSRVGPARSTPDPV